MSPQENYRVALDVYSGPLDLLLYLIKREEVDIHDIPIARVAEQYVKYVDLLQEVDPEAVGEFLVLAATLMEIKSRMLLPTPPPEEVDEDFSDPRVELVRQLLEYKRFKDAARSLEESAAEQAQKAPRVPVLPPRDADEIDLENLDIWDLFDAFGKVLTQIGRSQAVHEVDVDDTPIALHAEDVMDALERAGGEMKFEEVFSGRTRGEMIGLFLALLELIRERRVSAKQERASSPIVLVLISHKALRVDLIDEESETDAAAGTDADATDAHAAFPHLNQEFPHETE